MQMLGRMYFIMGYTDNDFFKSILNKTDNSWVQISESPDNKDQLDMFESNKL